MGQVFAVRTGERILQEIGVTSRRMNLKPWLWTIGGVSAGLLLYGAFVESERLVVVRRTIKLKRWPDDLKGYRVALIADFHLRDKHTVELTRRAIDAVLTERPDMIVIAGDFVGYWKPESPQLIGDALEALRDVAGKVIAAPGNHDYWAGNPSLLQPICEELGIRLLRNESHEQDDIAWIGIDSYNARKADPCKALADCLDESDDDLDTQGSTLPPLTANRQPPTICIWHEPDAVKLLPPLCDLMLSGHSHGGQFRFPGGIVPMTTKNGRRYLHGFYPDAPTPLYVTSGIGTTGPPSRFLCPPEVVLITLT